MVPSLTTAAGGSRLISSSALSIRPKVAFTVAISSRMESPSSASSKTSISAASASRLGMAL